MKALYAQSRIKGQDRNRNHSVHIFKAEKVLGRRLKGTEQVHHLDGDGFNTENENLIICPSQAYHRLLHNRQNAFEATGDYDKRKCPFCGTWSYPKGSPRMINHSGDKWIHHSCKMAYQREYRSRKG